MNPAPVTFPLSEPSLWWLDAITLLPLVIFFAMGVYLWRHARKGASYLEKQSDFLDHQKDVSTRALEQNKDVETLIARQYAETNQRSDRALAQSEEALRLHAAALQQLTEMNGTLVRVTRLLEAGAGPG